MGTMNLNQSAGSAVTKTMADLSASLIVIVLSTWSLTTRKRAKEAESAAESATGAHAGTYRATRKLFPQGSAGLDKIEGLISAARTVLDKYPTWRREERLGGRIMPLRDEPEVVAQLAAIQCQNPLAVDDWINGRGVPSYADDVAAAAVHMNGAFRASDYPPEHAIVGSFGIEWRPESPAHNFLTAVSEEQRQRLAAAAEADVRAQFQDATKQLASELIECVRKLSADVADRKSYLANGTMHGKTANSLARNLADIVERASAFNFTDDPTLRSLADEARQIVRTVDGERLKESSFARDQAKAKADAILANFGGMFTAA